MNRLTCHCAPLDLTNILIRNMSFKRAFVAGRSLYSAHLGLGSDVQWQRPSVYHRCVAREPRQCSRAAPRRLYGGVWGCGMREQVACGGVESFAGRCFQGQGSFVTITRHITLVKSIVSTTASDAGVARSPSSHRARQNDGVPPRCSRFRRRQRKHACNNVTRASRSLESDRRRSTPTHGSSLPTRDVVAVST